MSGRSNSARVVSRAAPVGVTNSASACHAVVSTVAMASSSAVAGAGSGSRP
ncbi:MAG TPA: hypothetical protein VFD42_01085 [Chloroflexota bacterium]|nr:hypothetical protein [Chloroflexota bacterium]